MIKTIGLTGNIGSGKTTVGKIFQSIGIPLYNADAEARRLMNTFAEIKDLLIARFGNEVYKNGQLNRTFLASIIFNDRDSLNYVNSLVHPLVLDDFLKWAQNQASAEYVMIEAAILFEAGFYKEMLKNIVVTAPLSLRFRRVADRDGLSLEDFLKREGMQWEETEKIRLADYRINNDNVHLCLDQVLAIDNKIRQV